MKEQHPRVYMSRAEYEAMYNIKSDPQAIGARFYAADRHSINFEIIFLEPQQEIEYLEELVSK